VDSIKLRLRHLSGFLRARAAYHDLCVRVCVCVSCLQHVDELTVRSKAVASTKAKAAQQACARADSVARIRVSLLMVQLEGSGKGLPATSRAARLSTRQVGPIVPEGAVVKIAKCDGYHACTLRLDLFVCHGCYKAGVLDVCKAVVQFIVTPKLCPSRKSWQSFNSFLMNRGARQRVSEHSL
jgi:hypothetical protein